MRNCGFAALRRPEVCYALAVSAGEEEWHMPGMGGGQGALVAPGEAMGG